MKPVLRSWKMIACMVIAFGLPGTVGAVEEFNHKTSGPVAILPPPQPGQSEAGQSLPPSLHLPGREFKSGDGWWALSCTGGCKLTAASLTVTPQAHAQYEGPMVPGQLLQWTPVPPVDTLLMFKPFRAPANAIRLSAGPVSTNYPVNGGALVRPETPGTMECQIKLSDGSHARLVPIFIVPDPAYEAVNGPAPLWLELRIGDARQTLGQFTFGIEGNFGMKPEDYLIWAGDLDGDGKLDLIVKTDFQGANIAIFLSSLARPGELLGEAGRFAYFPIEAAGC